MLAPQGVDRAWPGRARRPGGGVQRRWSEGQAASVRDGRAFRARDCGCTAVLMLVADQPFVTART